MELRDYIYVDLDRVISIYSQLTGGVVEVLERGQERYQSADNKRAYDFKILRHDAGGTSEDRVHVSETIKPHHAVLSELEELLSSRGFVVDLVGGGPGLSDPAFRNRLKQSFCVRASGRALIEDYERMKGIASAFPSVVELINRSSQSAIEDSAAYRELREQIDQLSSLIASEKSREARAKHNQSLKLLRTHVDELVRAGRRINFVEQWILDGMKTWIDAFLPGIINLRLYPDVSRPEEHVFGHLKRRCFEDSDTGSFHFTYGSFPTETLTILGVVTSVPSEEGETFRPLAEFERERLVDAESVEKGFRGVFRGFDGLEQMIRTCRFPRILVLPLMVYRRVAAQ